MTVKKRLAELIKKLNLTQQRFAQEIGVSQPTISDWINKPNVNPSTESLTKISNAFNINLNWLLTGEGSMYQQLYEIDSSILDDLITLPIVAEIAAGEPVEALLDEPLGHMSIPKKLLYYPPPYFVFSVKGKSMEPHIMNKDIVICSQDWRDVDLDGKIMAFRTTDGITLKKMVIDVKNKITWLMPINHEFTPRPFDQDSEEIVMIGILDIAIRAYNRSH
jgi:SOS-response transcriptional repressor LexA